VANLRLLHTPRILMKAAWIYRHGAKISRCAEAGQQGQRKAVRDMAWLRSGEISPRDTLTARRFDQKTRPYLREDLRRYGDGDRFRDLTRW
jgi:hypothetical protein